MKSLPSLTKLWRSQTGFSLVEILLVAVIAGMIIVVLTNVTPAANLLNNSRRENIARQIVAKKVEDIRAQGYDTLANGTSGFSDARLVQLPQSAANISVQDCSATICTKGEQIKQVDIQVSWTENNAPKTFNITTLIAKGGLR